MDLGGPYLWHSVVTAVPLSNLTAWAIAAGSDGNLWFVDWGASKVGTFAP